MLVDGPYEKKERVYASQGDLLENFVYQSHCLREGKIEIDEIEMGFVLVLSQACDLEQDWFARYPNDNKEKNEDKFIQDILICPVFSAQKLREGTHLTELLNITRKRRNGDQWGAVKLNKNERYHFLAQDKKLGIPELAIDFKQFFTVGRDKFYQVYRQKYKASLKDLFREHVSIRFAQFLSRIGLPEIKKEENEKVI